MDRVDVPFAIVEGPLWAPGALDHAVGPARPQHFPSDVQLRLVRSIHVYRNGYPVRLAPPRHRIRHH